MTSTANGHGRCALCSAPVAPGEEITVAKNQMTGLNQVECFDAAACAARQEANCFRPETRSGKCRGCGGPVVNAPQHRAMDGYCGRCAFDACGL